MGSARSNRDLLTLICLVIGLAVSASPAQTHDLSDADRKALVKYFGDALEVKPIEAKKIDDPFAYMKLEDGAKWKYRVTHGARRGKSGAGILRRDESKDAALWRFDSGGNSVMSIRRQDDGCVVSATEDRKNKVISRYDPPEPLLLEGLEPGASRKMTLSVGVYDADRPDHQAHSGKLDLTYTYVGAFEVTVPAGTFETVLLRWRYEGKVGPASVSDVQYWFLAKGMGAVAMVEKTDVSAVLFYQDHQKHASVLTR